MFCAVFHGTRTVTLFVLCCSDVRFALRSSGCVWPLSALRCFCAGSPWRLGPCVSALRVCPAPSVAQELVAGPQWRLSSRLLSRHHGWPSVASVVRDPSLLVQVLCLSQPFPPHFSHFVQSLSWRARLTASRVFFTWLASSSPSRHTRSTCKRRSAPSWAPRQRRAHPCSPVAASLVPVPAVPFFVEPSSPGPDRVEVEVHSPPLAFPRGSVVWLASKSRPAVPPSPSPSP